MKLEEVMTASPIRITPQATLKEAAEKMRQCDVGCLPVEEDGRLVGIVTDRDIVVRAIAKGLDIGTHQVQEIMSTNLVTASPDMDVVHAADMMKANKIRRLPVVQDSQLIGIVSLGDLAVHLRGQEALCGEILEQISVPIGPKCAL